jgi:hypothetical protein
MKSLIRFPNSFCSWKHPARTQWDLLKVKEENYKRAWWDQVEGGSRESVSSLWVLSKLLLTYGKGKTWSFLITNNQ